MEKGQVYSIKIEDMTEDGQGIGRIQGLAVFVPGTVIGDEAEVKLSKVKKSYAFANLITLKRPSEYRIKPMCEYAEKCGGCSLAYMSYERQLFLKEKQIRDKLQRIGKISNPIVKHVISMEDPFYYRNKASMPVSTGGVITRKGGKVENLGPPAIGFFRRRSREVTNCKSCMLQSPAAAAAAEALRVYMREDHITAWDERWGKGLIRHLVVKTAFGTGQVMVIPVINGKGIPGEEKLVRLLDDAIYEAGYELESVVLNINKEKGSAVMGDECVPLAGKGTITDTLGHLSFEISPLSFYQVNHTQMKKLYDKVVEYGGFTGTEMVLDIYCGIGTIGLYCASKVKQVIGIESVKAAVLDANRNAVINGIVNARYICGRAEEELPTLLKGSDNQIGDMVKKCDVAILDPPRAGCKEELLKAVISVEPKRIIYVSCDPATLARDVKMLGENGYDFKEATPVDMFPWTGHVETVVLMSRVQK